MKTRERRLRTSGSLVAGVSAMLVATAVLGLVYLVQPSFPFPPLGLAQRLLRLVPGPVAVFFIDRLGHWALRLFAVGFTVGSVLAGGVAGVVVARGPALSPGRVAPQDPAFVDTRKSLAGEFRLHGKKVFVVANHFSSKTADDPLFGRVQPPIRASEPARHSQAQAVNDFVDQLVAADPDAKVIVLGDINDFEFSQTVQLLEGGVLTTLMDTVAKPERYS